MERKHSPSNTMQQAVKTRQAWRQVGTEVELGGFAFDDFDKAELEVDETDATIARLETELAHARNQRVDRRFDLWQIVKQVRLAARVFYGEQSSEYEMFGGTRLSEQKSKGTSRSPEPAQA